MSDTDSKKKMAEAADKLDSALDSSERSTEAEDADEEVSAADDQAEKSGEDETVDLPDMTGLIERTETDIESLLGVLNGNKQFSEAREDIEDLQNVIEETGELLDTVDFSQLPEAIDIEELPSMVDGDEVPEAIATLEPGRAVELSRLASLVEFNELWGSVDVREFIRNKEELENATDEVTDDEDDDSGLLGSDESESTGSAEESGIMDSIGSSGPDTTGPSSGDGDSLNNQRQAAEAAIQSKLRDAIGEFRESVLDAREQVKEARDTANEKVQEKTGGDTGQPTSRNPTAFSTMTAGWKTGGWSSSGYSTVPSETLHSGAPNHVRIYGSRFDDVEVGEDDDE